MALRSWSRSPTETSAPQHQLIVVIEDNPPDVLLVEEALFEHRLDVDMKTLRDGEEAIRFIRTVDADEALPCPALFLLDLNIPTRNGKEVLKEIRRSKRCATTPVVIITSSNSLQDRQTTKSLGANYYFCKPADYDAFMKLGEIVEKLLKTKPPPI
jgi:DNA-binding response OmpR family regulator